jgi:hypothetical protein
MSMFVVNGSIVMIIENILFVLVVVSSLEWCSIFMVFGRIRHRPIAVSLFHLIFLPFSLSLDQG